MHNIKEFKETEKMTKDEAINEVKKFFEGNKKYIEQAIMLIFSTHDFKGILKMKLDIDILDEEKYLTLILKFKYGIKIFEYLSDDEYVLTIHSYSSDQESKEEYKYKL